MTELDQMAESDKIMDNLADLTLSEIQELKEKHKDNKMVKRTLDYAYKTMNNIDNNKHIDNLINTAKKAVTDKKISQTELEDLSKVLRNAGLLKHLTPDGKQKLLNAVDKTIK